MRCYYCAEDIRDEAVVCRYCGHDLNFSRPVIDRIASLEVRLASLEATVAKGSATATTSDHSAPPNTKPRWYKFILPGAVSTSLSIYTFHLFRQTHGQNYLYLALATGMPLPFGIVSGVWQRGKHVRLYALTGLLVGLFAYAGEIFLAMAENWSPRFEPEVIVSGILSVLGATLFFLTGGLIGDLLEQRFLPDTVPGRAMQAIARGFVGAASPGVSPDVTRVKRLAEVLTALTPLLTFAGSILSAYLAYKTALVKK